jgi:hypothetical protein
MGRSPIPMTPNPFLRPPGQRRQQSYESRIVTGNESTLWWAMPLFVLIFSLVGAAVYLASH